MASRRKSSRPVNKLRRQIIENDDDDEDDENVNMFVELMDKYELNQQAPSEVAALGYAGNGLEKCKPEELSRNGLVISSYSTSIQPRPIQCYESSPSHTLAGLPSDICRDFEALKTATNLDTTTLMRRLLQDYHRISQATLQGDDGQRDGTSITHKTDRPVDGVIQDLNDGDGHAASFYTDDQLAMRAYNGRQQVECYDAAKCNDEDNDERSIVDSAFSEENSTPLDLSTHCKLRDETLQIRTSKTGSEGLNVCWDRDKNCIPNPLFHNPDSSLLPHRDVQSSLFQGGVKTTSTTSLFQGWNEENGSKSRDDNEPPPVSGLISTAAPASPYVIDLEPGRTSSQVTPYSLAKAVLQSSGASTELPLISQSTLLAQPLRPKAVVDDIIKCSKLFAPSPSLMSSQKIDHLETSIAREKSKSEATEQRQPTSIFTNNSSKSPGSYLNPIATNSVAANQTLKEENVSPSSLPTYSEALTSILASQPVKNSTASELVPNISPQCQAINIMNHIATLNTKNQNGEATIDSYPTIVSPDRKIQSGVNECQGLRSTHNTNEHMLLQKIIQHQQHLFHLSQERLKSKTLEGPLFPTAPKDEQNGVTSAHNQTPCDGTHLLPGLNNNLSPALSKTGKRTIKHDLSTIASKIFHKKRVKIGDFDPRVVSEMDDGIQSNSFKPPPHVLQQTAEEKADSVSNYETQTSASKINATDPSTCPPVPTAFFMAPTSTGEGMEGMTSVFAIPVLPGGMLPPGVTALQPFAFAPNFGTSLISPLSASGTGITESISEEEKLKRKTDNICGNEGLLYSLQEESGQLQESEASSINRPSSSLDGFHYKNDQVSTESMPGWPRISNESPSSLFTSRVGNTQSASDRPRPGRPRGRGRRKSQQTSSNNKGIKLVTENTLFPGVYTSILKLPWSRRSRNKVRTKTRQKREQQVDSIPADGDHPEEDTSLSDLATEKLPQETSHGVMDIIRFPLNKSDTEAGERCLNPRKDSRKINEDLACSDNITQDEMKQANLETGYIRAGSQVQQLFPQLDQVLRQDFSPNLQEMHIKIENGEEDLNQDNTIRINCEENEKYPVRPPLKFHLALNSYPLTLYPTSKPITSTGDDSVKLTKPCIEPSSTPQFRQPPKTELLSDLFKPAGLEKQEEAKAQEKTFDDVNPNITILQNSRDMPSSKSQKRRRGRPPKSATFISSNFDFAKDEGNVGTTVVLSNLQSQSGGKYYITTSTSQVRSGCATNQNAGPHVSDSFRVDPRQSRSFGESCETKQITDGPGYPNKLGDEMTLESKISILTHQIGLEMSNSLRLNLSKQNTNKDHQVPVSDSVGRPADADAQGAKETFTYKNPTKTNRRRKTPRNVNHNKTGAFADASDNFLQWRFSQNPNQNLGIAGKNLQKVCNMPAQDLNMYCEPAVGNENSPNKESLDLSISSEKSIHTPNFVPPIATTPVTAPRRKKVSRILKSDGNFMYTSFKISPKGAAVSRRKTKRKRKPSKGFTEVESIPLSDKSFEKDTIINSSHCDFEAIDATHQRQVLTCPSVAQSLFSSIALTQSTPKRLKTPSPEQVLPSASPPTVAQTLDNCDLRAAVCVSCGNIFQRTNTEAKSRCDACLGAAPRLIKSSKLFALYDTNSMGHVSTGTSLDCSASNSFTSPLIMCSSAPASLLSSSIYLPTSFVDSQTTARNAPSLSLPHIFDQRVLDSSYVSSKSTPEPSLQCSPPSSYAAQPVYPSSTIMQQLTNGLLQGGAPIINTPTTSLKLTSEALSVLGSTHSPSSQTGILNMAPVVSFTSPPRVSTLPMQPLLLPASKAGSALSPSPAISSPLLSSTSTLFPRDMSLSSSSSAPSSTVTTAATTKITAAKSLPINSISLSPLSRISSLFTSLASKGKQSKYGLSRDTDKRSKRLSATGSSASGLFCGICRTSFVKICDYLSHVRNSHDNNYCQGQGKIAQQGLNPATDISSVTGKKTGKRKKFSLAQKTLTCPVEECPMFFREKLEIREHVIKKHPGVCVCPHTGCEFACSLPKDLGTHLATHHQTINKTSEETLFMLSAVGSQNSPYTKTDTETSCPVLPLFTPKMEPNPDVILRGEPLDGHYSFVKPQCFPSDDCIEDPKASVKIETDDTSGEMQDNG